MGRSQDQEVMMKRNRKPKPNDTPTSRVRVPLPRQRCAVHAARRLKTWRARKHKGRVDSY